MNRDEIIKMAREAECSETWGMDAFQFTVEELERFAAFVAAAERNAILQMINEQWFKTQADFETAIRARGKA